MRLEIDPALIPDLAIAVGDLLDSQDSSAAGAQSVDNRSQTQSGHDLVAEVLSLTADPVSYTHLTLPTN